MTSLNTVAHIEQQLLSLTSTHNGLNASHLSDDPMFSNSHDGVYNYLNTTVNDSDDDEEDIPIGVALLRLSCESQPAQPSFESSIAHVHRTPYPLQTCTSLLSVSSSTCTPTSHPSPTSKLSLSITTPGSDPVMSASTLVPHSPLMALLDEEQVSLATSVRLREAAAEFVGLDEHMYSLAPSEFKIRAVTQKVEHLAAEIRGTENEAAYLQNQLERERLSLNSPFVTRAKKADAAEEIDRIIIKQAHVSAHMNTLNSQYQEWSATKTMVEHNICRLKHVRDRMQLLFERVFNETRKDFPIEAHLADLVLESQAKVAALSEDVGLWDIVRCILQRMNSALTERWTKLKHLNPVEPISDETPCISELQSTLDNIELDYTQARKLQPSLPRFPATSKRKMIGSNRTLVGKIMIQSRTRSVQDIGRLVYDIRAIYSQVSYTIQMRQIHLQDMTLKLKAHQATLTHERTRILQTAVLARDRERARRTDVHSDASTAAEHDDDYPPPYSPPGYNFIQSSSMAYGSASCDTLSRHAHIIPNVQRDETHVSSLIINPDNVHHETIATDDGLSSSEDTVNFSLVHDTASVETANNSFRFDTETSEQIQMIEDDDDNPIGLLLGIECQRQASQQSCSEPLVVSPTSVVNSSTSLTQLSCRASNHHSTFARNLISDPTTKPLLSEPTCLPTSTQEGYVASSQVCLCNYRDSRRCSLPLSSDHSASLSMALQDSSLQADSVVGSSLGDDIPLSRSFEPSNSMGGNGLRGRIHCRSFTTPVGLISNNGRGVDVHESDVSNI
ncbi:hypothetical protein BDV3_002455 [Batrachochytrium dendrobatidis]